MASLSPTLLSELNTAIANRHLDLVADEIVNNAAECYAMVAVGEDDYSVVGNTRFGGDPDLPESVEWPTHAAGARRLCSNFIAQINFAELPLLSADYQLPQHGILYLFVRYMESAAEPVILDALFHKGDPVTLSRRPAPATNSMCDEYLVDLVPQRIKAIPSVSIAGFHKQFRRSVEHNTEEIHGEDGTLRRIYLESDLHRENQIGQVLGFANASDERENLYRQVALARLGKRELVYNDYWDSIDEYEAYIDKWRNDERLVKMYRDMREGVEWLLAHRGMITDAVEQWRLLFQLDSNSQMQLNINDADPLYVFIQNADLARMDFSNLAGEVTQG